MMKLKRPNIDKKARREMSFIMYHDWDGILAAIFSSIPLSLKQHSIRVGAVAGIIAGHLPESAVPADMSRREYANAVRYGGFYHDLGVYLRPGRWREYPEAGRRILEREISERAVPPAVRRVIIETVWGCGERCDGGGFPGRLSGAQIPPHANICAVADAVDMAAGESRWFLGHTLGSAREYVSSRAGTAFLPPVVAAFEASSEAIFELYRSWRVSPPLWRYDDLKPASRPYEKMIG